MTKASNAILAERQQAKADQTAMEAAGYVDALINSFRQEYAAEKEMLFKAATISFDAQNMQEPPSLHFDFSLIPVGKDTDLTRLSECYRKICQSTIRSNMNMKDIRIESDGSDFPIPPTYQAHAQLEFIPLTQKTIDKINGATLATVSAEQGPISQKLSAAKQVNENHVDRVFQEACGRLQNLVTTGYLSQKELKGKLQKQFDIGDVLAVY